jgi:16S rRNA C967 or C1407 C5-methylase (RsmB/RsmF family)
VLCHCGPLWSNQAQSRPHALRSAGVRPRRRSYPDPPCGSAGGTIQTLPAVAQAELLDAAAALVRPGGLLVYSTCSLEAEENEGQVAAFLARAPGFALQPAPPGLLPPGVLTPQGCLAMLPHVHGTDGAFAARLLRAP